MPGFSPFYLLYAIKTRLSGDLDPPIGQRAPLDDVETMKNEGEYIARVMDDLGHA